MPEMQNYRVMVSERAKQMLGLHIRFLARVNRAAVKGTKERLMEALRTLETMPQRYPFFEETYIPANKYHKLFVENWYLVLYQVKDQIVYVDYILDCRQDYGWLIQ